MSEVIVTYHDHQAVVTLNRPEARNAYSSEMITALIKCFDELELNHRVRVVILTGAGRAFSAGGDLKLMRDKEGMFAGGPVELRSRYMQEIHQVPRRLARFSKPVIAAINGAAIGAGLDLSLMCDLRLASTHAKFGSTFVKVGLIPGDGGAYYLTRAIGLAKALELTLTGRVIDAHEAERIGLVSRVVPQEQLMETAMSLAKEISANAPLAVQLTKAAAYQSLNLSPEAALQIAASFQGIAQNTSDHLEGVHAILAKRTPNFTGK
jgi:2-(1,2-epoxy-1,2-dihydrophenyl)acetyl-CoA isomerase